MGVRAIAGRLLEESDRASGEAVVVNSGRRRDSTAAHNVTLQ